MAGTKRSGGATNIARRHAKRSFAWLAARAIALLPASIFGWYGDLYWNVSAEQKDESPFARTVQWTSYVFWTLASLLAVTKMGVIAFPTIVFAACVVTLRHCAAEGVGLRPRNFAQVWAEKFSSRSRWSCLLIPGVLVPVATGFLNLPFALFTLWLAWALWITAAHWVSLSRAVLRREDKALKLQYSAKLAVVFRTSVAQFEAASEMHLEKETGALIIRPAPAGAVANRGDVEASLAMNMGRWELDEGRTDEDQLVLIPVTLETSERRLSLTQTGGLTEGEEAAESGSYSPERQRIVSVPAGLDLATVEGHAKFHAMVQKKIGEGWAVEEFRNGLACLVKGVPSVRPAEKVWPLKAGKGEKEMSTLARNKATRDGLALVEWDWDQRRAHVANTLPAVRTLRSRIAGRIGCEEHDLEIRAAFGQDADGNGILASVEIIRDGGRISGTQEKRLAAWFDVATHTVGAVGWKAHEDRATGNIILSHGVPRKLPAIVPVADLMPPEPDPGEWFSLPLGVSPDGQVCSADLRLGPHTMVAGPTGSGKTILLLQIMMSALARDHRVVLVDTVKGGADFEHVRPYCSGWVENLTDAAEMIQSIYDEAQRRKAVLKSHGVNFWGKLPEHIRAKENVHPVSLILDEYFSLILEVKISPLLKETELGDELAMQNAQKALISAYVGKLAREARYVGIHLYLAMQRPDATVIGGELRQNLTTAIQLTKPGALPPRTSLEMIFTGDQINMAAEELAELDDGSRGLAVMAADGGGVSGFRVGFAEPEALPAILENLGVPLATPWGTQPANRPSPFYEQAYAITTDAVENIHDLGELQLSLDDLEMTSDEDAVVGAIEGVDSVPTVSAAKLSPGNPLAVKAARAAFGRHDDFGSPPLKRVLPAVDECDDLFAGPAPRRQAFSAATIYAETDPFD